MRPRWRVLEGIRNGQSLGALLGYRFERGLHDDYGLAEVDKFIYPLRKAFPLVADSLAPTADAARRADRGDRGPQRPGRPQAGRPDHRQRRDAATRSASPTLPAATAAEAAAINAEANGLLDIYDAIADLALAEGVHQAAQGNFDRIAATLDAYTVGQLPARARGRPDATVRRSG